MVRNVLSSMIANQFYAGQAYQPDLNSAAQTTQLPGYSQLDEPPLYYGLASLPMRLFFPAEVTNQLYAGRLVSLLLFLLTIAELGAWFKS